MCSLQTGDNKSIKNLGIKGKERYKKSCYLVKQFPTGNHKSTENSQECGRGEGSKYDQETNLHHVPEL